MSDYTSMPDAAPEIEETEPATHFFCKFTFAQFFTIMILAVFTMGFMFYLGARYGNDYLRLGVTTASTPDIFSAPQQVLTTSDPAKAEEMLKMAREALQEEQAKRLEGELTQVLQNPGAMQQLNAANGAQAATVVPPVAAPSTDVPIAAVPNTAYVQTGPQRVNEYNPPANTAADRPSYVAPVDPDAQAAAPALAQQPAGMAQAVPPSASAFTVQVAATQDTGEANTWVKEWRDRGYSAFLMTADLGDKGRWYRVRLGNFPSKEMADTFASQLKVKEQVNAIVVPNE